MSTNLAIAMPNIKLYNLDFSFFLERLEQILTKLLMLQLANGEPGDLWSR